MRSIGCLSLQPTASSREERRRAPPRWTLVRVIWTPTCMPVEKQMADLTPPPTHRAQLRAPHESRSLMVWCGCRSRRGFRALALRGARPPLIRVACRSNEVGARVDRHSEPARPYQWRRVQRHCACAKRSRMERFISGAGRRAGAAAAGASHGHTAGSRCWGRPRGVRSATWEWPVGGGHTHKCEPVPHYEAVLGA